MMKQLEIRSMLMDGYILEILGMTLLPYLTCDYISFNRYYTEDKYFYVVDRLKELIKVKGLQVH